MARTKKELTEEEIGEPVEVEVKQPLDKIVPIRLSADHWAELYRYAHELGIGPTTLARMWILEKLALFRAATSKRRLTLTDFIGEVMNSMPEDVRRGFEELAENSVMPADAEKLEDVKGFVMLPAPLELTKDFYHGLARFMGIEIVEEKAEAKEPKVVSLKRLNPNDLSPSQIENIIEIIRKG